MSSQTSNGQVARPLNVGDIVENFGAVVRVESIDPERGALVSIIPFVRDGKAQGGVGQRYYANPALCSPV